MLLTFFSSLLTLLVVGLLIPQSWTQSCPLPVTGGRLYRTVKVPSRSFLTLRQPPCLPLSRGQWQTGQACWGAALQHHLPPTSPSPQQGRWWVRNACWVGSTLIYLPTSHSPVRPPPGPALFETGTCLPHNISNSKLAQRCHETAKSNFFFQQLQFFMFGPQRPLPVYCSSHIVVFG